MARRRWTSAGLALLLIAGFAAPAPGQVDQRPAATVMYDSVPRHPVLAARHAARERGVAGYFVGSFLGGITAGFSLPVGLTLGSGMFLGIGAGGAMIVGVNASHALSGDVEPPWEIRDQLLDHSHDYERAFREAYGEELRARRVRASLWVPASGRESGSARSSGSSRRWATSEIRWLMPPRNARPPE